jgi:hypothetical protein
MKLTRPLTPGEWAALSPGLMDALRKAGSKPVIRDGAHPGAKVAKAWRGKTPILTRGDDIWWPGASEDFSRPGREAGMAVLQHELQHVLEYATGQLTAAAYLTDPRNWTYGYKLGPDSRWSDFGAEQRASIVETLWKLERGGDAAALAAHRKVIPWA